MEISSRILGILSFLVANLISPLPFLLLRFPALPPCPWYIAVLAAFKLSSSAFMVRERKFFPRERGRTISFFRRSIDHATAANTRHHHPSLRQFFSPRVYVGRDADARQRKGLRGDQYVGSGSDRMHS